jgi:hypothetical protein
MTQAFGLRGWLLGAIRERLVLHYDWLELFFQIVGRCVILVIAVVTAMGFDKIKRSLCLLP